MEKWRIGRRANKIAAPAVGPCKEEAMKQITEAEFETEVIQSDKPVVLKFTADW